MGWANKYENCKWSFKFMRKNEANSTTAASRKKRKQLALWVSKRDWITSNNYEIIDFGYKIVENWATTWSFLKQISLRYMFKALILVITCLLSFLLYTHFMMSFFAYFTDPSWYTKSRLVDYIQLSHEPNKWAWGNAKRDHFSYHKSTTVFWYKNDGPFAAALFLFHILFFLTLFSLYLYWVTLLRRVYTTKEITYTYTTYCVSSLRQFFYYSFMIFSLVLFSFIVQYWRLPIEYFWVANTTPLITIFTQEFFAYPSFLVGIIFQ